jgi:hypothetical protein
MCTLYLCAIVRVCRREQPANPLISRHGLLRSRFAEKRVYAATSNFVKCFSGLLTNRKAKHLGIYFR